MPETLKNVKSAALETYVTVCSPDARRIRAADEDGRNRCVPTDDQSHIAAAAAWLCRAHDMGVDDGVSAMFSLVEGWQGSYPETTGYIIPTMLDLAHRLDIDEYRSRAIEMADWLLSCQASDGSYPSSFVGCATEPRVFNTGQIIFGLHLIAAETGDDRYMNSAVRAGDWLCDVQDEDGAWRRSTLDGIVHVYNVRTAWALASLGATTGRGGFIESALANAQWTLDQQDDSGWFRDNTFTSDQRSANLHTVCYAMRGLLEIGDALDRPEFIASARRAASALHRGWQLHHEIGGALARDWSVDVPWRCLPGEAQLAIVWLRLDQVSGCGEFGETAVTLLERVKSAQIIDSENPDLHGGISGSVPINGDYERYCLVNWGPKFLIDALLLKARSRSERRDA